MIIALLITNIVLTLYSLYNIAAVQHLLKGLIEALSGDYKKEIRKEKNKQ